MESDTPHSQYYRVAECSGRVIEGFVESFDDFATQPEGERGGNAVLLRETAGGAEELDVEEDGLRHGDAKGVGRP